MGHIREGVQLILGWEIGAASDTLKCYVEIHPESAPEGTDPCLYVVFLPPPT
jgi:hypothetical protein